MLTHICHVRAKYRLRLVMLRYFELVKSFSVMSICERTVFVYQGIHIFVANSRANSSYDMSVYSHDHCKRVSIWYRLVWTGSEGSRYRILHVKVSSHTFNRVDVKAIDVRVATHRIVFSHRILLVTCHVIKDKNRIWTLLGGIAIVGKRKIADFVDRLIINIINFRDIDTF